MSSILPNSLKISKGSKRGRKSDSTYSCGECLKTFTSYPAYNFHVKQKHQGKRPKNSKVNKRAKPLLVPTQSISASIGQTGRPTKPLHNVDDLSYAELCLEETQNELLGFLGEKLMAVGGFEDKIKLEDVVNKISAIKVNNPDKWFTGVQEESRRLFEQHGEDMNLDFEDEFRNLDPNNGFSVLEWFVLWLGKYFVKKEFISDLAIVLSRIWKVLDETELQIQDLDNKLVWKKTITECKANMADLPFFNKNEELLYEFIQKTCQLIGKAFENNS